MKQSKQYLDDPRRYDYSSTSSYWNSMYIQKEVVKKFRSESVFGK